MATKIVTKNSSTASAVPTASDLVQGELAVNVADKRLFTEDNAGAIVELGTNPSTIDINAGSIDGTAIGASSASTGAFTTLTATGAFTSLGIDDNADATAITIDSSENVGIGTSSPSSRLVASASNGGKGIELQPNTGSLQYLMAYDRSASDYIDMQIDAKNLIFGTNNSSERMRIDSSGNVGIGTTSPDAKVHSYQSAANYAAHFESANANSYGVWVEEGASANNGYPLLSVTDNGGSTQYFRVDSGTGNVGIGTSSPTGKLDVTISTDARMYVADNISEVGSGNFAFQVTNSAGSALKPMGFRAEDIRFATGSTERARIDSSGDLIVGGTSSGANDAVSISNSGYIQAIVNGDTVGYFNRRTSDGEILRFQKDGSTVGSIGASGGDLVIGTGDTGIHFHDGVDSIMPWNVSTVNYRDAAIDLGTSSYRFKDIYRSGSTYQTSDRSTKQDIRDLTDAERNVAVACKGLLKAFRFIDAVEKDGDDANIHFGVIAQELAEAFEAEGLDANDYQVYKSATTTDEEGNEQTRLNVCYENLLAFIISAI
jgi:hypothetical protein